MNIYYLFTISDRKYKFFYPKLSGQNYKFFFTHFEYVFII